MMFSKLFIPILAATLASAAALQSKSTKSSTLPATSLPKHALTASTHELSLANFGINSALVDPTLILCTAADCASGCAEFVLVGAPQNVCLTPDPPFSFISLAVLNPDATVIPFAVLVGSCIDGFAQIPQSNVCFNFSPAGTDFAVIAGSTP